MRAGVVSVMPAFTDLAGLPMTCHTGLLRDYLRGQLGFDGVIVSDYNAIAELIKHGVAADLPDAAARALAAGVDIDMMSDAYRHGLPVALERGAASMAQIDTAVRRVLTLKLRLGLFDDPYRRGATPEAPDAIAQRRQLARSVAARSIVLLKNTGEALPLDASLRSLAVLGPLAAATGEMRGPWWAAGTEDMNVNVVDGLRAALPGVQIRHAAGVAIEGDDHGAIADAVAACDGAQAVVLCLGEAASRANPALPGEQQALAEAVAAHARERGVPLVVVLFSGRPLVVPWLAERADALLAAWFLGCEAGNALADVLTGRVSPSGRTPMSWPRAVGQVPVFFGQRPTGRPADPRDKFTSKYLDVANEPLYPFGHGLSYGKFTIDGLRVSAATIKLGQSIAVEVEVTNAGTRAAEETVFLFTRDKLASVARPLLELRGFGKITLAPGARGTVRMALAAEQLRFLGADLQPVFEPGEVEVLAGPCADRACLLGTTIALE